MQISRAVYLVFLFVLCSSANRAFALSTAAIPQSSLNIAACVNTLSKNDDLEKLLNSTKLIFENPSNFSADTVTYNLYWIGSDNFQFKRSTEFPEKRKNALNAASWFLNNANYSNFLIHLNSPRELMTLASQWHLKFWGKTCALNDLLIVRSEIRSIQRFPAVCSASEEELRIGSCDLFCTTSKCEKFEYLPK